MIITLFRVELLGEQFRMLLVSCEASGSCAAVMLPVPLKLPALALRATGELDRRWQILAGQFYWRWSLPGAHLRAPWPGQRFCK